MEEIELNGESYVLKSKLEELQQAQKDKEFRKRNDGLMDLTNVAMMLILDETEEIRDVIELKSPPLVMKRSCVLDEECKEVQISWDKSKIFTPNQTRISLEFVEWAQKIASTFYHKKSKSKMSFLLYEGWNQEEKKFLKDYPVMLVYERLAFVIAPRVETGD